MTLFSRDGVILDVRAARPSACSGARGDELVGRKVFEFMALSAVPEAQRMVSENRLGFIDVTAIDAAGDLAPTAGARRHGDARRPAPCASRPCATCGLAQRLEAERRGLEQQEQRTQRLDSLGVLAGGIAHDFNNLLTGVLGHAQRQRDRLTAPDDQEIATAIITAAQRAAALTRQMLAYAGQRDLGRREPVDVGQLVRELRGLLGATLSKKAELELLVEAATVVMGDQVTLGQVVMNLLTNASDALGDLPGRITVRARHVSEVDARWDHAQGATVGPGRWVLVEVEDTGAGMDEATRGRAFEPFFSTKEKGHGLGLPRPASASCGRAWRRAPPRRERARARQPLLRAAARERRRDGGRRDPQRARRDTAVPRAHRR